MIKTKLALNKKQEQIVEAVLVELFLTEVDMLPRTAVRKAKISTTRIIDTLKLNEKFNSVREKVCQKKKAKR